METVLLKAFGLVFIIALAYFLKKVGFFKAEDANLTSKIMFNLTLPAAVITSFAHYQNDHSLFLLCFVGFGCGGVLLIVGWIISRRKSDEERIFYMLNLPGYNIGCFTMPFVQSFIGQFGVVATCMFDMGNSIICTGGSYAATCAVINNGEKTTVKSILKKLFSSIPFDVYLLLMVTALLGFSIPDGIVQVTSTIGSANSLMAMLTIGLMFELKPNRQHTKKVVLSLLIRYGFAVVTALICYHCLPFSLEVRQVLVIISFAPIPALAPVFTAKCGGDTEIAGLVNSISILISIVAITALVSVMGLQ